MGNFGQDGLAAFAIERWSKSVSMAPFVKLLALFAFDDEFKQALRFRGEMLVWEAAGLPLVQSDSLIDCFA